MDMQRIGVSCLSGVSTVILCLVSVICVNAQCERPILEPGFVLTEDGYKKDKFPSGSSLSVKCGEGYSKIRGNSTIVCDDGNWTSPTLKCKKKSCGSPGEVINGYFNSSGGTEFGATVYAHCNQGFEIVGTAYRQCYAFGWTHRVPTCEILKCGDPPEIDNGRIISSPSKEFPEYGDVIEYACEKNYFLFGKAQIVCNENGTYGSIPTCGEINCPPPQVENGIRTGGGPPPYKYKSFVSYGCKLGYTLEGSDQLVCEGDGWSHEFPKCRKDEVIPPRRTSTASPNTSTGATTSSPPVSGGDTHKNIGIACGIAIAVLSLICCVCVYCKNKKG
ncbi:hypothetical protein AGOR_G00155800 [Albula goreensis]|uniref:Sushi domain-containing protein n=1 Tax=Albula goreensis TaxID=1534307 RepID=A0A8T3D2V5_9TELE|nr:hypothetical protein AGOR_G00155800 [Albula goreensis]